MNLTAVPELFISLTLQASIVIQATRMLARRAGSSTDADRIWSYGHFLTLLIFVSGVGLPHLRILQHDLSLLYLNFIAASSIFRMVFATLFVIWVSGVLVLSARTLRSLLSTTIAIRQARMFSAEQRADIYSQISGSPETCELLDSLRVSVLYSNAAATPFCWQLQHPVIVLPISLKAFPDDELQAILRHEVAHLRANHPLKLFLQTLVEVLFWFHPLVRHTAREASLQRELASDLAASRSESQAAAFLSGMLRLTEFCTARASELAAGLGFTGPSQSMTQARVKQLLSIDWSLREKTSGSARPVFMLWLTACMAAVLWIPVNAQVTDRTMLSPWPSVSAALLHECGIVVRDYELDNHRLRQQNVPRRN